MSRLLDLSQHALAWRSMISWRGVAVVAVVVAFLAALRHPIVSRMLRRTDKPRAGTLEVIYGGDDAKFEIIAVHGLGADPYHTWTRAGPSDPVDGKQEPEASENRPARESRRVHLLKLLAHDFPDARIMSFAHNSNWLIDAPVKTTEEIGKRLLEVVKAKRLRPHLPIIFIGHSLGGIIIKQALCRDDSKDIIDDTCGIIFLGTPHQGSSVSVAAAVLAFMTSLLGSDQTLLTSLRSHEGQLSNLAERFRSRITAKKRERPDGFIVSFYETKPTYLFKWLSLGLVVSRDSAVVHADKENSIDTDHSGLNKCAGPDDVLYKQLSEETANLKAPSLLEQADSLVCEQYDRGDRLKIKRLSGHLLPMKQCYINLAIVEQSHQDADLSQQREAASSPFSLLARQNIMTPDEAIQADLETLFHPRKGHDGGMLHPRRILIRGRAGVGKTTLCKKMVYEFSRGTWSEWNRLFDRILWIPLRNLKGRSQRACSHEDLFYDEYFSRHGPTDGRRLAECLCQALRDTNSARTLFLLDGWDEIAQELGSHEYMSRFIGHLLGEPNIIITSRPNAHLPADVDSIHLELETIGFYPEQVKHYIERSFTDAKTSLTEQSKVDEVETFLQKHWLIQGLVRIPIQLDALCYTWDGRSGAVPDTMTAIYREIELKLWQKDISRLRQIPEKNCRSMNYNKATEMMGSELYLLEALAFTGLYNDILDFDREHRNDIYNHFELSVTETLIESLSFLRTSDLSSEDDDQNYHFIHLTFQEFFAARYFIRQWKDHKPLEFVFKADQDTPSEPPADPVEFLQSYKYMARYDIMWRFVAGLLDQTKQRGEEKADVQRFFEIIGSEPVDLLGPTHQRLVMHCLSEVPSNFTLRRALEAELSEWLIFESDFAGSSLLARESECPHQALCAALEYNSTRGRQGILNALQYDTGRRLSEALMSALVAMLDGGDTSFRLGTARLLGDQPNLSETTVSALVALVEDKDSTVRSEAAHALGKQSHLSEVDVATLTALLEDKGKNSSDLYGAAKALGKQSNLPNATVSALVALLNNESASIRSKVAEICGQQSNLSETTMSALAALLEDKDSSVRTSTANALRKQPNQSEATTSALAALEDKESSARSSAARALGKRPNLFEASVSALAALLQDEHYSVRSSAARALGKRPNLFEASVSALAALLQDEHYSVRSSAARALGSQPNLSETSMSALAALLQDKHRAVRDSAARALGKQPNLPQAAMSALAVLLKDKDYSVRSSAAQALGKQPNLSEASVSALAALLKDEHNFVRSSAVQALGQQPNLSEAIVSALVLLLTDGDTYVRLSAFKALGNQENLSKATVSELVALLKDKNWFVRYGITTGLGERSILIDNILGAIGLSRQPERLTAPIGSTIHDSQVLEPLYGCLLWRAFREHSALYFDVDHSCIIYQANGAPTASFKQSDQVLSAVSKGRQLWNIHGYKLWDREG